MVNSVRYDIDKELRTMILNVANNNPAPMIATISSVSDDKKYASINLSRGGTLASVKCLGIPTEGQEVLVVFPDGSYDHARVLCLPEPETKEHLKCYNVLENGNFQQIVDNTFKNWIGGNISTDAYYNSHSCELKAGGTLISKPIDVTSLTNSNEAFTVSFIWKKSGFTLQVYDQNSKRLTALPTPLGAIQQMDYTENWSFQRYNYPLNNVTKIKLHFTNNTNKTTYLDGIRVWKPDDYQEWFPSIKDKENGGV